MSESRTDRFRGRSLPNRNGWEVSTIAYRGTNRSNTATCPVTNSEVALDDLHYYVTIRTPGVGPWTEWEYDSIVVADGALGELDQWLEGGETE